MIVSLVNTTGSASANVSQKRRRNASGSWPSCILLLTSVRAEPHVVPILDEVRGGVHLLHLHPTDGIDCVAVGADTAAVSVHPVGTREQQKERDVQECRVVPREV